MKKFAFGSLAVLALTSVAAQAADIPLKAMPIAAPAASWTGFFLGAGGGYGMFDTDHTSSLAGTALVQPSVAGKGWFGTVQVGGDYQFADRWVLGAFGDIDFSDIKGTSSELVSITNFPLNQRNAYAAGARIGYLLTPQILSYVDGGYTHANFNGGSLTFAIVFTETLKPSVQTVRTSLVYKFNYRRRPACQRGKYCNEAIQPRMKLDGFAFRNDDFGRPIPD